MSDKYYDLIVIGGGAGGLFAASVANALKAKVCLVEKKRLGGDCTWYGCMPSKTLLKSASVANLLKRVSDYGLKLQGNYLLETSGVMSHVRDVVFEISNYHTPEDLREKGIEVVFGSPRFVDKNTIEFDNQYLKAKRFIICTGSHPLIPPIEGLKEVEYLTNESVFGLDGLPKSLIVLGGGPIGVEIAQALGRLGVKITIVEMLERILFREESELVRFVEDVLREETIDILTGKKAVRFSQENGYVNAVLEGKDKKQERISAEGVLVAVGRAPNIEGLDLERAGVEYTAKGIKANEFLQTTNPHIFTCGDVVSPYQFSHVAAYQGGVCVRNALFRRLAWQKVDYDHMTWATFTDPELAHLGLTEGEARKKVTGIQVYSTSYTHSDRSVTDVEKKGLIKVITNKKGLILGAHVVGAHAGEIIQGFLIAKSQKIPLSRIASTLFIYPTLSELVKKTASQPLVEIAGRPVVQFLIRLLRCL